MQSLLKYPRTPHLEGSRSQPGDEDLECYPYHTLHGCHLVIEEKIDGANAAISFDTEGAMLLQSRGHYLTGGPRERHFALFKTWAQCHRTSLWERLGTRYIMYGEWLYAKHTIFYDALPHYFLEFDLLDRESARFLSTERRQEVLGGSPVHSVPILHTGPAPRAAALPDLIGHSLYKSPRWRETLAQAARELGLNLDRCLRETDSSPLSEGLYVKWEQHGEVRGRFKYVRASFLTSVAQSESHWQSRPILPNRLAAGVDIYSC